MADGRIRCLIIFLLAGLEFAFMNVASLLSSGHILEIEHQLRFQAVEVGQVGAYKWKRKKSMMVFWRKMRRREEKWNSTECSSLLQKLEGGDAREGWH